MRKTILVLTLLIVTSGCSLLNPLAKLSKEELSIDIRDEFDPMSVLTDVKEGTEVSYELDEENSKLIISLVNGDKTQTLKKDVTILYPLGELLADKISYYTYKDFNGLDYIKLDEDVTCDYDIDFDNAKIVYHLKRGDREEDYTADLDIVTTLAECDILSFKDGGDINTTTRLMLDDIEYWVFDQNENELMLLSVNKVAEMPFNDKLDEAAIVNPFQSDAVLDSLGDYNHNGTVDSYEGVKYNIYRDSPVDRYLENEFYPNMSEELKNAVVEKTIDVTCRGADYATWTSDTIANRHVYLGDIKDWQGISPNRVFKTFVEQAIQLRSDCGYEDTAAWDIWSYDCNFDYWNIIFTCIPVEVNPMFVVDANKLPSSAIVK